MQIGNGGMEAEEPHAPCISGRLVVVTGGGSGIGKALSIACAELGARMVAVIDRDMSAAEAVSKTIRDSGGHAAAFCCDVTVEPSVQSIAKYLISSFGSPGLVCANAGVTGPFSSAIDESSSVLEWVFAVNFFGVTHSVRAFAKSMCASEQFGHILFTGSEHSIGVPHVGMSSYSASKHALLGYADVLRRELPSHVGVTIACPGSVDTFLWKSGQTRPLKHGGPLVPDEVSRSALRRGVDPSEVARQALDAVAQRRFLVFTQPTSVPIVIDRVVELEAAANECANLVGTSTSDIGVTNL